MPRQRTDRVRVPFDHRAAVGAGFPPPAFHRARSHAIGSASAPGAVPTANSESATATVTRSARATRVERLFHVDHPVQRIIVVRGDFAETQ